MAEKQIPVSIDEIIDHLSQRLRGHDGSLNTTEAGLQRLDTYLLAVIARELVRRR